MNDDNSFKQKSLSCKNTIRLLENLRHNSRSGSSYYFSPGKSITEITRSLEAGDQGVIIPEHLLNKVAKSKTGFVLFALNNYNLPDNTLIIPPVPVSSNFVADTIETLPLIDMLGRNYGIAIILIRLGNYAIGVASGDTIVSSKVGSGLVHGRHRQGGSSQGRFPRHRNKQIEAFLLRVCNHLKAIIEPHVESVDYIIYGGAWTTIAELKKRCHLLSTLNKPELPPILNIPDPKSRVLKDIVRNIWTCNVFQWSDDITQVLDI